MRASLRTRISVIVLSTLVLFAVIVYGIQKSILYPSFLNLERNEAQQDIDRCAGALDREIHHLDLYAYDWAAWDDTYRFVEDANKEYLQSNLNTPTFTDSRTNLIYIFNNEGKVVFGKIIDLETEEPIEIAEFPTGQWPSSHPLLGHKDLDSAFTGIYMTQAGPCLIASRPIITSKDEGPIKGTLIMGRLLTASIIETIREQTRVDLQLWPIRENQAPVEAKDIPNFLTPQNPYYVLERNADFLWIYTSYSDIQKNPALLLRADIPRTISQKGRASLSFALFSLLAAALAVLIIIWQWLNRTVVKPLGQLANHATSIGRSGDLAARLETNRRDEIGLLTQEFNQMVGHLAEARRNLMDQSYYVGMAEMASGVLHNIRNAMSPITVKIEALRQGIQKSPLHRLEKAHSELDANHIPPDREKDLSEFIRLGGKNIIGLVRNQENRLEEILGHIKKIEEILSDQDKFSRAEKPAETLSLMELVNESMTFIPDDLRKFFILDLDRSLQEADSIKIHRISFVQVLSNIVRNAAESIQRTNANGRLSISARSENQDGVEMLHLIFADNGEGIAPENLPRLFERGFSSKEKPSSGLGLHWCANTILSLKGRIYAESKGKGLGASVHLLIPKNG
ncbi:MAG: CHASE4 domain-containing protein [Candidatus Omnitrophota bacterium]